MYFSWIRFSWSLTAFLSYFLCKETWLHFRCSNEANSLSASRRALKGIARGCTCSSFHSRKAYKRTIWCWVGRSYLQICFYFAVFRNITKWKHRVKFLATQRCPLFLYCFPQLCRLQLRRVQGPHRGSVWGPATPLPFENKSIKLSTVEPRYNEGPRD